MIDDNTNIEDNWKDNWKKVIPIEYHELIYLVIRSAELKGESRGIAETNAVYKKLSDAL